MTAMAANCSQGGYNQTVAIQDLNIQPVVMIGVDSFSKQSSHRASVFKAIVPPPLVYFQIHHHTSTKVLFCTACTRWSFYMFGNAIVIH